MQARASCAEITDGDPAIAAPRLVFPMSPMRVTSQRPTLFWTLPPGVDGARVELCRDRCCTEVLQTIDAVGSSVRVPEALRAGVVFWRARGRVGARHGRDTSFTWEFGVRHRDAPGLPPMLSAITDLECVSTTGTTWNARTNRRLRPCERPCGPARAEPGVWC